MTRDYEFVYIFRQSLEEERVNEKLERFHGLVAGPDGGEITAVDHWGLRPLAYEIEGETSGYYVVAHVNTDVGRLPEFERILTLDEEVIRYLIVVNEGNLATSPVPPQPRRDDDEEGDDEGRDS